MYSQNREKLDNILKGLNKNPEVKIESKGNVLRIDIKPNNLLLWSQTLLNSSNSCNLFLACDSDTVDLDKTTLTWIVGSAVREITVKSSKEVINLLTKLGIHPKLAKLGEENCPGLGEDIAWAFYLDRNGWLTASPILRITEAELLLSQSPIK